MEKVAELGAEKVVPLITERSDAKWAAERANRWARLARAASKQSLRAWAMELSEPIGLGDFLEKEENSARLYGDDSGWPLMEACSGFTGLDSFDGAIVIGPEGGLTPYEQSRLEISGFVPARLGHLRLRVETASVSFLAAVKAITG